MSTRTPWQLLKKQLNENSSFSLRHEKKRSCHRAPLDFLLWRYTSFLSFIHSFIHSLKILCKPDPRSDLARESRRGGEISWHGREYSRAPDKSHQISEWVRTGPGLSPLLIRTSFKWSTYRIVQVIVSLFEHAVRYVMRGIQVMLPSDTTTTFASSLSVSVARL